MAARTCKVAHNRLCELCGEPMPPGEDVFRCHGYSGICPKPPMPATLKVVVEYTYRDNAEGYWINIVVDRQDDTTLGPFATREERQRAHDDLLNMMRSQGAADLSKFEQ